MEKLHLELKKVVLERFTPRNKEIVLNIVVNKDGKEYQIKKTLIFISAARAMQEVMGEVKRLGKKQIGAGDDILDRILIVDIKKYEEIEERLFKFFRRFEDKFNILSRSANAGEYMRLFSELTGFKIEF